MQEQQDLSTRDSRSLPTCRIQMPSRELKVKAVLKIRLTVCVVIPNVVTSDH
jgi:hypothetical protein